MRCIYCKKEITEPSEEHLFPKAFGCSKSYKLDCVCKNCNNKLGNELVNYMSYDSIEGVMKKRDGMKVKIPKQAYRRITFQLPEQFNEFHPYNGAYVNVDEDGVASFPLQIAILEKEKKSFYIFDTLQKDDNKFKKIISQLKNNDNQLFVIAKNNNIMNQLINKLKNMGVNAKKLEDGHMNDKLKKSIPLNCNYKIDLIMRRYYTYIAFNLLIYFLGYEFAIKERFDLTRKIILGKSPQISILDSVASYSNIQYKVIDKVKKHYFEVSKDSASNVLVKMTFYNSGLLHIINFGQYIIYFKPIKYIYNLSEQKLISL